MQSIIDILHTDKVLLSISQPMLLFFFASIKLLNFGMGAGYFERYLATLPHINVSSVEKYYAIITRSIIRY